MKDCGAIAGQPAPHQLRDVRGWKISSLTLGTLQFGGNRGAQDDQSSIRAVHAALDAGITVIDTADSYGAGHSEEIIGQALGHRRTSVLIATKFDLKPEIQPSRSTLRQLLTDSLRRLRTDWIDLYQVHNVPREAMRSGELFEHLAVFRDEGLLRAIGITAGPGEGHGAECIMAARHPHVESVQAAYSLLSQSLAPVTFPYCASRGVAIFAREPLAQGLLTDALEDDAVLRMGRRSRWTTEQIDRAVVRVRSFDRIRSPGESRAEFALRFALSNGQVTSIVVGMRSADEVASNIRAVERAPLAPDVLQEIVDIYDSD
jgi:aryl-alcohol dehydrogenase-like predicted oxidoreductase